MKKILIVEDEKQLRDSLKTKLISLGYEIILANDGKEAVVKYKEQKPDIILLDIVLPYKNGFEVLEEIRISLQDKNTPVIILSNLDQQADIDLAKRLKVSEYLIKADISLKDLAIKIDEILRN